MSKVIGYKERDFDNEYGITPTYEGDGKTTKASLKSLIAIIKMAIAQNKIVKEREENKYELKEALLEKYFKYKDMHDRNKIHDIKEVWRELTFVDYLFSESTYFWQIFINTIHQSLKKDSLLKYIEEEDYLTLIGNMDDISHLLPFYDMWDVSRRIREDKESFNYWKKTSVQDIESDYKRIKKKYSFNLVEKVVEKYGYHSDKELDVTYPCYYEDVKPIITNIKDLVELSDEFSPKKDIELGKKRYNDKLEEIKNKIGPGNYADLEKMIVKIRDMLWWREEFRDLSTRFYYLIRVYTIRLSEELVSEKVLKDKDDIWFLKVGDIWNYLDEVITKEELEDKINKNKYYYNSYRNYMSDNEIGSVFSENKVVKSSMKGLGANNGTVTGTARVIESFDEIDRLKENDILITKFTDTGWTPKFAILSGIVTEYGGILCHAAIVSREYGIPCIVSCTGIMDKIKDGETITINGTTGEISKGEGK
jgi:pyruvate,water dikinase